jgi:hypothetical protein
VSIVKCPCYFLSTFGERTPFIPDRIVIADHNNIIFIKVLCNQISFFVCLEGTLMQYVKKGRDHLSCAFVSIGMQYQKRL